MTEEVSNSRRLKIADKVIYTLLAIVITFSLFFGVNDSISNQNEVLKEIQKSSQQNGQLFRALSCVFLLPQEQVTLPDGTQGLQRDAEAGIRCYTDRGLKP